MKTYWNSASTAVHVLSLHNWFISEFKSPSQSRYLRSPLKYLSLRKFVESNLSDDTRSSWSLITRNEENISFKTLKISKVSGIETRYASTLKLSLCGHRAHKKEQFSHNCIIANKKKSHYSISHIVKATQWKQSCSKAGSLGSWWRMKLDFHNQSLYKGSWRRIIAQMSSWN